MKKTAALLLCFTLILVAFTGCNKKDSDKIDPSITKHAAYNLYYDTIKRFVPELMNTPQQCDVDVTCHEDVTFLTEHFVRDSSVKVKSQIVDDKVQYCLLSDYPAANNREFYCIDNDKLYTITCGLDKKGDLVEWDNSHISSFIFPYLITPLFGEEAILSFNALEKDHYMELSFTVNGAEMEYGYSRKAMVEINPGIDEDLDIVEIVLTVDEYGTQKNMSTKLSMTRLKNEGDVLAKKTIDMDYVFNAFDNISFDLGEIIAQYSDDTLN